MKKIFTFFTGLVVVTLIAFNANAAYLWPLEVGQRWTYQENNPRQFVVDSVVSLDSSVFGIPEREDYFFLVGSGMDNMYVKATDEAIYGWSDGGTTAFMLKIGMDWVGLDHTKNSVIWELNLFLYHMEAHT